MPSRTRQNSSSRSIVKILLESFTYLRSVLFSLPYDEDFGVVLLRLGTQSLEAAAGRGWRNEVAGVYAGSRYFGGLPSEHEAGGAKEEAATQRGTRGSCKQTVEYGSMRIGRADVGGMVNASVTSTTHPRSTRSVNEAIPSKIRTKTKALQGLRNEIRTVSSSFLPLDTAITGAEETDRRPGSIQRNFLSSLLHILGVGLRLRALKLFVWAGIGAGIGIVGRMVRIFRKNDDDVLGQENGGMEVGRWGEGGGGVELEGEEEDGEEAYRRFLRGESFTDSDEEDGEYGNESDIDVSKEDEDELDEEADEDEYADSEEGRTAGQNEVLALLADILFSSRASDTASGSGSVGQEQGAGFRGDLAHLLYLPLASTSNPSDQDPTAAATGPMTRGRWGALAGKYSYGATASTVDYENDEERWLDQRRRLPASGGLDEAGEGGDQKRPIAEARACVVCLTEVREVICWPCRWVSASPFLHLGPANKCLVAGAWQCVMGAGKHLLLRAYQANIGVRVVDGG